MVNWYVAALIVAAIVIYLYSTLHQRHYEKNGVRYIALYVELPGYATGYRPEDKINLVPWIGTKFNSSVVSNKDDSENPEMAAGKALQATIIGRGYELKEENGHYILYRAEETIKYFTFRAYYRISRGKEEKKLTEQKTHEKTTEC